MGKPSHTHCLFTSSYLEDIQNKLSGKVLLYFCTATQNLCRVLINRLRLLETNKNERSCEQKKCLKTSMYEITLFDSIFHQSVQLFPEINEKY